MPLVFIHGVNVRQGALYDKEVTFRDRSFIDIFYRELGRQVESTSILNPYWGHLGASPSDDNPFLPRGQYQMLYAARPHHDVTPSACAEILEERLTEVDAENPFLDLAREGSLADVVDVLWDLAGEDLSHGIDEAKVSASDLARQAYKVLHFAQTDEASNWLKKAKTDEDLFGKLDALLFTGEDSGNGGDKRTSAFATAIRTAGKNLRERIQKARLRLRKKLKEAGSTAKENVLHTHQKIQSKTVSATAKVLFDPLRSVFHNQFSLLIGDSFIYFAGRTTDEASPICTIVLDAIKQAASMRTAADPELIVVGHSMGGIILCDILTHFGKEIDFDIAITVGSQFPLFADLKMFPGLQNKERPLPIPENVRRWINIFDPHDFLGYPASHLFQGIDDFHLPSGTIGGRAHMDYFNRRSFYSQLGRRIGHGLPASLQ